MRLDEKKIKESLIFNFVSIFSKGLKDSLA